MDKSLLIQKQIKDNAEDLHNYVRELKLWEEEMKRKDRQLSNESTEEVLPPVRRPKLTTKTPVKKEENIENKPKRLTSYDYRSWDKFDVEKACEEIDNEDNDKNKEDEDDSVDLSAQEEKYLKEKALYEKELGNKYVKASKWDEAIECYRRAIDAYPRDPIFFANRALCYLKKEKFELVESDCTESLKLDTTYVKAMLRRAAAREALGRVEDASYDLRNVLRLEPNNSQALRDLDRLKQARNKTTSKIVSSKEKTREENKDAKSEKKLTDQKKEEVMSSMQLDSGKKIVKECSSKTSAADHEWEPCSNTIQPIFKPPHMRSKKSLKRIEIYDIGPNSPQHVCARKSSKSQNLPQPPPCLPPVATTSREGAVVAPAGPAVVAPTGSAVIAPAGPAVIAPAGPTVVAPTGPAVVAPAGPAVIAPAGPTVVAPTGPAVVAPAGPAVIAPAGPAVIAPAGPAVIALAVPAVVAPTGPAVVAPTGPAVVAPTGPAVIAPAGPTVKPRSVLTVTAPLEAVPPPPTTSVQFHTAWNSMKSEPRLRYRYLKQISGESLPAIFKESLESGVFSSIVETLASQFTAVGEPVVPYLRGLVGVRRFSTLALFMSPTDKSNLMKLFDHCVRSGECSSEDIDQLRRLYELS